MKSILSFLVLLLASETLGLFPENSKPISTISREDVQMSIFTGGDTETDRLSYVQDIKRMKMAGKDVLAITSRNNLYVLDLDTISPSKGQTITYNEIFTWTSDTNRKSLCVRKGQTEENCGNYLRVLESMDESGEKLIVCATNSYSPLCKYITVELQAAGLRLTADEDSFAGTEKCAFGPDQTGVSLYTGGALYSGTVSEFSGRSYTITRNLGETKQLRTPKYDPKFINEPQFVRMIDDGDRVLIFMNEIVPSRTGDFRMVAHIAQVCKNDHGGQHVLARQWTKFVKTRLNCSMNGFYFDQLQDISDPVQVRVDPNSNATETMVFATFSTPENSVPGSAVCAYTLDSIHQALRSRFKENGPSDRSSGRDATPPTGRRVPGYCPEEKFTDAELQFLKSHPLLEEQVRGTILNTHVGERWTSIAVDTTAGPHRNWTVYFVGTSSGALLKYLAPLEGAKAGTLLSRQEIYDPIKCSGNSSSADAKGVTNVLVDPKRDSVVVGFKHCVLAVPMRQCSVHACKESCIASGDPYCGWNGESCISYTTPNVNIEQYVIRTARNPPANVDDLCTEVDVGFGLEKDDDVIDDEDVVTTKSDEKDTDVGGNVESSVNGTTTGPGEGAGEKEDKPESLPQDKARENPTLSIVAIIIIAVSVAVVFFILGFLVNRCCCKCESAPEKDEDGIDQSKASMVAAPTNIFAKVMASISPKRRRKPVPPSASHSITTLSQPQTEAPLIPKNSKEDEAMDVPDSVCTGSYVSSSTLPYNQHQHNTNSRLNSVSSHSQVTMNGSVATYNPKRRGSHMTPSVSSMSSKPPPSYATAPRPRHPSGNRSSDPGAGRMVQVTDEFATARIDGRTGNKRSRHSTPVPVPSVPSSPCSKSDLGFFNFREEAEQVVNNTEHTLKGVEEVIAQQQRRSQEMEPLEEDPNEARPRHDSTDSGNGSSPRNSLQTEEEQNRLSTLPRPEHLELGQRGRRQRLNSEPTSPQYEYQQRPLPPPSSHKPVARSISMRSQQQPPTFAMPNGYRQRSGSFNVNSQPSTPSGKCSPPRSNVSSHSNYPHHTPQQQQLIYATLPTNPNAGGRSRGHPDKIARQQSFDAYSQLGHNMYIDQQGQPIMVPDKYSSLPIRSQAHRSKKNMPQYSVQPGKRLSGSGMPPHPHYQHQWSSPPAIHEHQRPASAQRLRYVPPPTVPGTKPSPVPEMNAV